MLYSFKIACLFLLTHSVSLLTKLKTKLLVFELVNILSKTPCANNSCPKTEYALLSKIDELRLIVFVFSLN